ncbi:MAG: hypothetical protein HOF76_02110 [Candidatus Scalindua sp.]|jgi:hypothetical protein|nr:hypothetical protein [Candidatus Scalindua sp.]MBT6049609.1 hypothetical protein [Candidatus Scalindua sp.]MBT7592115.1 hypothetical protein [Candidatus Scalindua sp.]
MKIKQLALQVCALLFFSIFVISCATTTSGLLRSANSYEQVFRACNQAVSEVNFGVTSSDIQSGFIAAELAVVGEPGNAVHMSISVIQASPDTKVEVSIVPPPLSIGNIKTIFNNFTKALKKRVPDIEVVSVK